jgi:hypothetical protein
MTEVEDKEKGDIFHLYLRDLKAAQNGSLNEEHL